VPEDVASIPDEALTFLAGQVYAAAHELLTYAGRGGLLVGAVADPDLGPALAVGFGGGRAGLGRGAAFRLLPVTGAEVDADRLGRWSGRSAGRFRGSPLLDREALRELMLRFALLLRECP
jgi:ATP-grasp domain